MMTFTCFSIGQTEYMTRRLSAMDQFLVAKRLLPIAAELIASRNLISLAGVIGEGKIDKDSITTVMPTILQVLADALPRLSDEDCKFVVERCLKHTQVKVDGAWAPVANSAGGLMNEKLNALDLITIVAMVLKENLMDFC